MKLESQQRAALNEMLWALMEAGEPEVFLSMLKRVAEKKSLEVIRGGGQAPEAWRWLAIYRALDKVEAEAAPFRDRLRGTWAA